jgi:hypothetical protein
MQQANVNPAAKNTHLQTHGRVLTGCIA